MVIGAAFGAVITSLVEDVITPLLGIFGLPTFTDWVIPIGSAEMSIGNFLNTIISFVTIALAIFFIVVKPMNRLQAAMATKEAVERSGPSEIELLTEIRDELRRGAA